MKPRILATASLSFPLATALAALLAAPAVSAADYYWDLNDTAIGSITTATTDNLYFGSSAWALHSGTFPCQPPRASSSRKCFDNCPAVDTRCHSRRSPIST